MGRTNANAYKDRSGPRPGSRFRNITGSSLFLYLLLVLASSSGLAAQETDAGSASASAALDAKTSVPKTPPGEMLSSYEGQNVSSIEFAGQPDLDPAGFSSAVDQKTGEPFSQQKVEQTAAAIKSAGKYEEVRIRVDPESNGVRSRFVLEPAVYIGIFQFPGAEQFPYSRLIQVANYPVQAPFDAAEIERDRKSLLNFYRQSGFFQAEVRSDVKVDQKRQIANVSFAATLGPRAKFGEIFIDGVPPAEQERLRASLQTTMARARTVAIRPGKRYRRSTIGKAATYLQAELEKKGQLNAQVKLAGAEYHADTNRADIHFNIVPGPTIKVDIQGAHVWPWTRKSLLPVYQGIGVDDESVEEGRQALASYFQSKGFFDVKVESHLETVPTHDEIVYRITKQKKHKVADIKVAGNNQLPSSQLMPHITIEKKRFFSSGKFSDQLVRDSVKNLKAVYDSEGFSDVAVVPTVTNRGGDINVAFRVTEGPRDMVSSLTVEGADTFPPVRYAPNGLKLAVGQPYSQAHVQQDRANIVANYLRAGYLTSSFRETATAVSKKDSHHINVVYHIYEGPKVITGDVITLGREHTAQQLINRDVAMLKPEQPLTETDLLTAGSRLYDLPNVFDWAEVDPRRDVTTPDQRRCSGQSP